jgi:glycosyltransferase involved in cell wall biosynthesis
MTMLYTTNTNGSKQPQAPSSRRLSQSMIPIDQPLIPEVGVLALVYHHWGMQWMTPHHVLTRLARYYSVVWVNPAHGWREMLRRWRVSTTQNIDTIQSPGFIVYTPESWLPKLYRPELLARFTCDQRLKRACRLLTTRGCRKIILYLWHPTFEHALQCIPFDLSCYHIDDEYSFSEAELPLDNAEKQLIAAVNQVFIISPGLLEKKGAINPYTAFVPEGVNYQAYATPVAEPSDLATIPHPRIGYTGWIKKQLDCSLILHLTERHPEWSFVFVGGRSPHPEIVAPMQELYRRRNVYFLGAKSTTELAYYPQHFDVCIMPYTSNAYTQYIYPLKLHEYLASGRPTVGTRIRSLEGFAYVVALASTSDEWSTALNRALSPSSNTAESRTARQAVARQHDWQYLVAEIAKTMARGLGQEFANRLEGSGEACLGLTGSKEL